MAKAQEYRDQAFEELEVALQDITRELFELKNEQKFSKKLDKPTMIREKRKDIARIKTIMREKEGVING